MDSDDAADLLGELDEERRASLLAKMEDREYAGELEELVEYEPDSAGGLMTTDYVWIYPHRTTEATIAKIRQISPETEFIYYLYVTDNTQKLLGTISLRSLLLELPTAFIHKLMDPDVVSVTPDTSAEDVAATIARYDLLAVPVLDPDGRMLGIVTVDDAIDAIMPEKIANSLPAPGPSRRAPQKMQSKPYVQTAELEAPDDREQGEAKSTRSNFRRRLLFLVSILGPGFVTASAGNDVGGIFTYSVAGAQFGYSVIWTLIPIAVALIVVQEMAARMGAVTGKGLAALIREEFGVWITLLTMLGLFFMNTFTTSAEFAGIASASEIFGMSRYISVPLSLAIVFFFVLTRLEQTRRAHLRHSLARLSHVHRLRLSRRSQLGRGRARHVRAHTLDARPGVSRHGRRAHRHDDLAVHAVFICNPRSSKRACGPHN